MPSPTPHSQHYSRSDDAINGAHLQSNLPPHPGSPSVSAASAAPSPTPHSHGQLTEHSDDAISKSQLHLVLPSPPSIPQMAPAVYAQSQQQQQDDQGQQPPEAPTPPVPRHPLVPLLPRSIRRLLKTSSGAVHPCQTAGHHAYSTAAGLLFLSRSKDRPWTTDQSP